MAQEYKVERIIETYEMLPDGTLRKIYEITATTQAGVTFTLTIPEAEFRKETAEKRLRERADELDAVMKL